MKISLQLCGAWLLQEHRHAARARQHRVFSNDIALHTHTRKIRHICKEAMLLLCSRLWAGRSESTPQLQRGPGTGASRKLIQSTSGRRTRAKCAFSPDGFPLVSAQREQARAGRGRRASTDSLEPLWWPWGCITLSVGWRRVCHPGVTSAFLRAHLVQWAWLWHVAKGAPFLRYAHNIARSQPGRRADPGLKDCARKWQEGTGPSRGWGRAGVLSGANACRMARFHTKVPHMARFHTKMPRMDCSLTKTPPVASFLTKMALNLTAVIKQLVARVNVLSCLGVDGSWGRPFKAKIDSRGFLFLVWFLHSAESTCWIRNAWWCESWSVTGLEKLGIT